MRPPRLAWLGGDETIWLDIKYIWQDEKCGSPYSLTPTDRNGHVLKAFLAALRGDDDVAKPAVFGDGSGVLGGGGYGPAGRGENESYSCSGRKVAHGKLPETSRDGRGGGKSDPVVGVGRVRGQSPANAPLTFVSAVLRNCCSL